MAKSLLIIGSSGFIGQSILDYLGKKTFISKKLNKITLISKSKKNKISNSLRKKYKVIQILSDISKIKNIPKNDLIIYCALSKNLKKDESCIRNFCKVIKLNKNKCSILYTSSGAVYGKQNMNLDKIKDGYRVKVNNTFEKSKINYSIFKIKNEKSFRKINKKNFKISIARCFTFVGKNLPLSSKFVIGNLINSIINKKNIVIKSKKRVTRSYMHSDLLAEILLKIVLKNNLKYVTYNVGSDDPIDIHETSKVFAKKYKLKHYFNENANKSKKEDRYVPDISKFRKKFNFYRKLNSIVAINKAIKDLTY